MHLTMNLYTSYKTDFFSFSYEFMFDRIICVLVRIKVRGHLLMSIIQFMHLISVEISGNLYPSGPSCWKHDYTNRYHENSTLFIINPLLQDERSCTRNLSFLERRFAGILSSRKKTIPTHC